MYLIKSAAAQRPSVTTDILLFRQNKQNIEALLILRKNKPFQNQWAIPGGFVDINEDIHNAAVRELNEECSIQNVKLEQIYAFGQPDRDPRDRIM